MWIEESSTHGRDSASGSEGAAPKQLERLKVSSGHLLIIDQFMLANAQFLEQLPELADGADPDKWVGANAAKIRSASERYGGCLLEVGGGNWGVLRDAQESLFIVGKIETETEQEFADVKHSALDARGNMQPCGRVFVDTRCLVFVDSRVLADRAMIEAYGEFRRSGNDKAARDRLRESGAAVRYGFNRNGDELGVFKLDFGFALWPDVVE